jgi:hypothetical protein
MSEDQPPPATVAFRVRPETIRDLIHKLALNTKNIKWSRHAEDRMYERGISDKFAVDVMRYGSPKGEIEPGRSRGEWKVKMVYRVKGQREVGVVVITVREACLYVKTVEWEDMK